MASLKKTRSIDSWLRRRVASIAVLAILLSALPALAEGEPSAAARTEARERYSRGLVLFDQGDNDGALAEFERAFEIAPHPLVRYNIALVHVAAGRPVEAVEALQELLKTPNTLSSERLERARALLVEQRARVGTIEIRTNVERARIELDGRDHGEWPLTGPMRVPIGKHVVGLIATGYHPRRLEISVAGGQSTDLDFELEPLEGRHGHVRVETKTPGAAVRLDGARIGTTPLATELAVAPGQHEIELSRPGYVTARQEILVSEGGTGTIQFDLRIDDASLTREGGTLELRISEDQPVVFVDGSPIHENAGRVVLPAGEHRVRVERSGFFPVERTVVVPRGSSATAEVTLAPTPDYRADYMSSARTSRVLGWSLVGGGALVVGAGVGYLVYNASEKSAANQAFDAEATRWEDGGECKTMQSDDCVDAAPGILLDELGATRERDTWGWVGVGVGAAAVVAGAVFFLTGDDPERYEPSEESDLFGRSQVVPLFDPEQFGAAWTGHF